MNKNDKKIIKNYLKEASSKPNFDVNNL